jgi:hypothetical protein
MKKWIWMVALVGSLAGAQPAAANAVTAFLLDCEKLSQDAEEAKSTVVKGKDGWLFLASELRHISVGEFWGDKARVVSRAAKPENADPLPAILDFKKQLAELDVKLIVVPVPPKVAIYPDMVCLTVLSNTVVERLDAYHLEFYQRLRDEGVAVLDLVPEFLAARNGGGDPLFCKQDTHWSGSACVLVAQDIAKVVRPLVTNAATSTFKTDWADIEITGDLWQMLKDPSLPKEKVRIRKVTAANSEPLATDQQSPVVLLGDSYDLVYHSGDDMFARGAGLADQLAVELGFPVDLVAVRGSGATPARINLLRRAQKNPQYWSGKKVVIWCFGAREFTESDGWRKVPIKP